MQRQQATPDYFSICTCLVHLSDAESAAKDLLNLTQKGGDVSSQLDDLTIVLLDSLTNRLRSRIFCYPRIPPESRHAYSHSNERIKFGGRRNIRGRAGESKVLVSETCFRSYPDSVWRNHHWHELGFPLSKQQN